jgi:excisionase family DNA binding protein
MSEEEVSGSFRIRGEGSGREKRTPDVDPRQLALLLAQLQQQLEGLAAARPATGPTFGELAEAWWQGLDRVWPEKERRRFELLRCFWAFHETGVLTGFHKGGYSGAYVNKIRNTGKLIVAAAIEAGEWKGLNPFEKAKRLRQTKPNSRSVTIAEARAFLPHLREDRFWLAFTMLSIGLRPGEMLGLKKIDVDLSKRELLVRRSHDRDETKTGVERTIHIPDELAPVLRLAMQRSPSREFVFGHPDGGQWRADTKLSRALQHAFRKAGMCIGYDYSCRRRRCGFRDYRETLEDRQCPRCEFKLWTHGRPKAIHFYDLRHSCATLHKEAGCDPWVVERTLGHSQNITGRDYTHCSPEFQRAQLNKLKLLVCSTDNPPGCNGGQKKLLTIDENERLDSDVGQHKPIAVELDPMTAAQLDSARGGTRTHDPRLRRPKVGGSLPDPLDTRQAAVELGIEPYTVRDLVRTGRLTGSFRIGHRIRIPRSVLEAFKANGGAPGRARGGGSDA